MDRDPKDPCENTTKMDQDESMEQEEHKETRRDFLAGLGKWSAVVIGGALFGGSAALPGDSEASSWRNNGGGGRWRNRGHGRGWHNSGGGGRWRNRGGGGRWRNRGGGGGWHNSGGGGHWRNRGGGGHWRNRGGGGGS
ncbi:hypothetical protein ACFL2Q_12595 [Thermodesulfobacteriota bacterium]